MSTSLDGPAIPVRPAAYIRVEDAAFADDMTWHRDQMIGAARQLGWPVPATLAELIIGGSLTSAIARTAPATGADVMMPDDRPAPR